MKEHDDKVKDIDYLKRRRRLPISDVAEPFVSVTDVKHYLYCPKIVYFDRALHAEPHLGSQQEESSILESLNRRSILNMLQLQG